MLETLKTCAGFLSVWLVLPYAISIAIPFVAGRYVVDVFQLDPRSFERHNQKAGLR